MRRRGYLSAATAPLFSELTQSTAIVIRQTLLTETSLIIGWCCRGQGLVRTVAKGARRPRSAFAGRLDLFATVEIGYAPSRRSDLHMLREASVAAHRFGLRESWLRVLAASYFVRLIEQVAEPATPIPELFDLLTRALDYLDGRDPDMRAVIHFERELARCLGIHTPAGGAAIQAIRQMYHSLPPQRQKLLAALQDKNFRATDGVDGG